MSAMKQQGVHELFSAVAEEQGKATAIDRVVRRATYAELECASNQVANRLLARGVARNAMVGVVAEDPIEIVTAILGVLKAGGVFVPLDPTFPEKRLQVMVEQVRPQWYVLESKYQSKMESIRGAAPAQDTLLDDEELKQEDERHPHVERAGDDPCSIYFTSGSTGKPKAILGRLKGIDHFVRWEAEALGVGAGTRVSQLASPSFDGFLKDVFVPLCVGGVSCAPEKRQVVMDAGRLMDWVDVEGIEVLHCVPSVLRALLNQELEEKYFAELKWVVLAGEALLPADVRRWMKVFGERIGLVNLYGPTETTVTKLYYFVQREDVERPTIPIGKPIPGAAALVVNAAVKPCPTGVAGEIYIRTPYRALGYYGEPELTREVFVPNPFSNDAEDIIYRTGDYGRLLEDGNFEFLGRRDQQVKVRGVRVELAEIENQLRRHEGVKDVAVVDREDGEGNKYLCAYVVVKEGTTSSQLREYLQGELPEALVPTGWVRMQELPRTLNGKVDRRGLPALAEVQEKKGAGGAGEEERPRTAVEEIVAGIWQEVLHLPRVGVEENFFELGGHSLLATQIISRMREALQVELTLRVLFESPTVAGLARRVEEEVRGGGGVGVEERSTIPVAGRDGELVLSYSQQRMWVLEQLVPGNSAYNIPVAIRMQGTLNLPALEQTFAEVMRRHEVLRTVFPNVNGNARPKVEPFAHLRLPVIDLSGLKKNVREAAAHRIARNSSARPFDLAHGPLIHSCILHVEPDEHLVISVMHHIN